MKLSMCKSYALFFKAILSVSLVNIYLEVKLKSLKYFGEKKNVKLKSQIK